MGSTFVVDISGVQSDIRSFEDGVYEAKIEKVEHDVSASGNPMLRLNLEIYSEEHGTASVRDFLPEAFPAKVKSFWQAVNDFTAEEMAEQDKVEIDPDALPGATFLIQLGDQENKTTGKVYKTLTPPWYYPLSRASELLDVGAPV